jgi:hypothetical protein
MVTIAPPLPLTKLEVLTDDAAPRPDGKNLRIEIDIDLTKLTALFHCHDVESVGKHKARKVTFRANHDCLIRFSNPAVFNLESVQLTANRDKVLTVKDQTKNETTFYEVYVGTGIGSATESLRQTPYVLGGPHIVVP